VLAYFGLLLEEPRGATVQQPLLEAEGGQFPAPVATFSSQQCSSKYSMSGKMATSGMKKHTPAIQSSHHPTDTRKRELHG